MSKSGKLGEVLVSGTQKQVYGFNISDNSLKWGSTAKRNPDGSFVYDDTMQKTDKKAWDLMILERIKPLTKK